MKPLSMIHNRLGDAQAANQLQSGQQVAAGRSTAGRQGRGHVFQGNRRDAMTMPEVLTDLERRFGIKRIVFAGLCGVRGYVDSGLFSGCRMPIRGSSTPHN